jgi:hypothetical protein
MATGQTLATLFPADNEPPAASYATLDTRNSQPCLDFDGSADEEAVFSGVMPSHYAGGGISVILHVGFTSATSGTANIECSVERGTTDKDADSFDTMTDGSAVPNGTSGIETKVTINLANNDSIVAGDHFRLKVRRDADGTNGTDDVATDMELYSIELREV